jgi:hypothetical protein
MSCHPVRGFPISTVIDPSAFSSPVKIPASVSNTYDFCPVSALSACTTQRIPLPQASASDPSELRISIYAAVPGVRGSWIAIS